MKTLTKHIKTRARQLGFDLVGVTEPDPSGDAEFYREWLARGFHAGMAYLARQDAIRKRADPRLVFPATRSIVVVGMNYYPGEFPPAQGARGRVSRYAWGVDYHDVILRKLNQLGEWINGQTEQPLTYRAYVDSGPLLERELAKRAGLGWIGRNTSIIHPKKGSYFFLGELLLSLELESDAPFAGGHCGGCRACLDACPTQALVAPYTVDARRCISYLTIEHRGAIPEELRPRIDDWVFGCDVCQEVCPWNRRFARRPRKPDLRPFGPTLDLVGILGIDPDGFQDLFRETPLWRARRAGLLRNTAVVLGNLRDPAARSALELALSDPDPLVAKHAAWALSRLR
ncbi:MAG: tRNA epoxyqueuosine(34) reductase QueG [Anaerolineae bacterium]|jgi:epoxyqueuosine reductase